MGKKKAIAEVLHAELTTTLSERLYNKVYDFLKDNDSFVYFNIMQYKFTALMDNPINEELDYKIMLYMMEKMKENYPDILNKLVLELQNDSASLSAAAG